MGRVSCIIQVGPEYNQKCPYKSKAEGDLITAEEVGDVMMEAEVGVMQ